MIGVLVVLATPCFARSLTTFGMCLDREGAIFYGTSWCPKCRAQNDLLGGAARYVHYVECSADGGREVTQECEDAGIKAFPTWVFADGSRQSGRLSVEALAAHTGCSLDDGDDASDD